MACDLETILAAACESGIGKVNNPVQLKQIIAQLLCEFVESGGGGTCAALSGDAPPDGVVTPEFIGQLYNQNNGEAFFYSDGLTSADWVQIVTGGASTGLVWGPVGAPDTVDSVAGGSDAFLTSLTTLFPMSAYTELSFGGPVVVTNGIAFGGSTVMTSLEMRLLESCGGSFFVDGCTSLATLSLPLLDTVVGDFNIDSDAALTSLSLPALVNVGGSVSASGTTSLTSFSAPLWLPTDGTTIFFSPSALDDTSVNLILARCIAAGVTSCTIDLSGGTSSAPTGQGIIDAADLVTAGNTVTTN